MVAPLSVRHCEEGDLPNEAAFKQEGIASQGTLATLAPHCIWCSAGVTETILSKFNC
jgi:hypothetical protein